jgi:hypothetical protein
MSDAEPVPCHAAPSPSPLPQTPRGQRIPSPERHFTPEAHVKLNSLKRKANELSHSPPPQAGNAFVKWRLLVVQSNIDVTKHMRYSLKETYEDGKIGKEEFEAHRSKIFDEQDELEAEEKELLGQGKFLEEDLNDSIAAAEKAYINELYRAWRRASSEGNKDANMKERVFSQNKFNHRVGEHLGAERLRGSTEERFCSAMGVWMPKQYTKCAHLVPKSFETKHLAYMFGTDDAALANVRNGLIMNTIVEGGFDNGWITTVPYGSVEATPTEWQIILLKDSINNDTIYGEPGGRIWRWKVTYKSNTL